jgi:hypothetical protein
VARRELLPNNPGALLACYYCGGAEGRVIRYPSPFLRPVHYHPSCYTAAERAASRELRASTVR